MIFVLKLPDSIPAVLKEETETKKVIAFYKKGAKGKKIDYKVYRDVKSDLLKIFNGKCAYCESDVITVSSGDVEHFRPKNLVLLKNGKLRLGYYWLGAEWDNLILSCELCNRKRLHEVDGEQGVSLGKQNQFPLRDETFRCGKYSDDISKEEPHRLLLHPCKDDPELHLEFSEDGIVKPRDDGNGPSDMGEATIEVVALSRQPLVRARSKHYLDKIKLHAVELNELRLKHEKATKNGDKDTVEECEVNIDRKITHLKALLTPEAEYLAMTRQLLRPILALHDIKI